MNSRPLRWALMTGIAVALTAPGLAIAGLIPNRVLSTNEKIAAGHEQHPTAAIQRFLATPMVDPPTRLTLTPPTDLNQPNPTGASLFGWAFLNPRTGYVTGSANDGAIVGTMESAIKPWIVADYLRLLDGTGRQPTQRVLDELALMIVDSNDILAEKYYRADGSDSVVRRMAAICRLASIRLDPGWWSLTLISPADLARYGECLADGRAAGPYWTAWVLDTMKHVRGGVGDQASPAVQGGRWGIIDGLPKAFADNVSIKNGWTLHPDGWHVSCLAVDPEWTLSVMVRTNVGLATAAAACSMVASSLLLVTRSP